MLVYCNISFMGPPNQQQNNLNIKYEFCFVLFCYSNLMNLMNSLIIGSVYKFLKSLLFDIAYTSSTFALPINVHFVIKWAYIGLVCELQ